MSFTKTTRFGTGRGAHHHVVHLDEQQGQGLASFDKGHTHQVIFQPEVPAQLDPVTGEMREAQPSTWIVLPAEDGHTHDIADYEPRDNKGEAQDDEDIVAEVQGLFKAWGELESESIQNGKESEDFYFGKQWKSEDKETLEKLNRACLTYNFTKKYIDELSGTQRQQRTDLKYLGTEDSDQIKADLLSVVAKHILERCYFEREEAKVFLDQVIPGRGNFNILLDTSESLEGDIKVERFPWDDIVYGPHEKEDLSDCEGLIKHKMYSKGKLKQLYPDLAEQLETDFHELSELDSSGDSKIGQPDMHRDPSNKRFPTYLAGFPTIDIAKKEIRVFEAQRKIYKPIPILVFADSKEYFNAEMWDRSDVSAAKTIPGVVVVEKVVARIRLTRIAGKTVLLDENPADLPANDFTVIPVYAHKRGHTFQGKVESAKDAQRGLNKRRSQSIDVVNKVASYGWFYDEQTFADDQEKEKFKKTSTSPGFTVQVKSINRIPVKVEGVKFPGELVQMSELDEKSLSDLLNISADQANPYDSGSKILQMQKMKLLGNEFLFDNLSFAKKKLGRLLAHWIQKFYTPERIYRLVNSQAQKQQIELGGQPFEAYSQDEILGLLSNPEFESLDCTVTETTYGPTADLATYMLVSELAQSGTPVPPEVLLELAPIPVEQKQKILSGIQQQQQQAAQEAQATKDAEIEKTLIAQGAIPPSVQEQYFGQGQVQNTNGVGGPPAVAE